MKSFPEIINGKSVVFVGACPNIKGRGLGRKIDDCDVVVRSNNFYPAVYNHGSDYGVRVDVLYTNNQYYRKESPLPYDDYIRRGMKYLCMKRVSPKDKEEWSSKIGIRTIQEAIGVVSPVLPSATAGVFLTVDILRYRPRRLHLTGIDFFASRRPVFKSDQYDEYIDGYLTDKIREEGNRINVGKSEDAHDFLGNAKYFKELFDENKGVLTTEDDIYELLCGIVVGKIRQGEVAW